MKSNIKGYLLLPIRSVLFMLTFLVISVLTGRALTELSSWWSVIASVINIVVIGVLIAISKANKISYLELINYKKGSTKFSSIFIISMIMLVVGMGGMYLAGYIAYREFPYLAPMMIAPIPLPFAIINLLVLPITTTLAEDGLYLGYGVNHLNKKWIAIALPAFFYGLQHCFIPTIFQWQFIIYRLLSFLPLTIFICFWYERKRNPIPVMVGHIILNMATAAQILMTSAMPSIYAEMLKI